MKHKFDVFFRTIAATFGGYFTSVLFSIGWVPVLVSTGAASPAEAVMVTTMLSYVLYFSLFIFCFCRKHVGLLWRDMLILFSLCIGPYFLLAEQMAKA